MSDLSFDTFLFRCSSLGRLMTYPEKDTLSAGPKTFLSEKLNEELYGKSGVIQSKYFEKGILCEEEAISMYGSFKNKNYSKNQERFNNEYITGEPDLIYDDIIIDIKCPWNYATFPFTSKSIPTKDKGYYWQLQGYMGLTGLKDSVLAYCLVDTPDGIIFNELNIAARKLGLDVDDLPQKLQDEIWDSHKYENTKIKHRIKEFKVERNQKDIDSIYKRVDLARDYLNNLTQIYI